EFRKFGFHKVLHTRRKPRDCRGETEYVKPPPPVVYVGLLVGKLAGDIRQGPLRPFLFKDLLRFTPETFSLTGSQVVTFSTQQREDPPRVEQGPQHLIVSPVLNDPFFVALDGDQAPTQQSGERALGQSITLPQRYNFFGRQQALLLPVKIICLP